MTTASTTPPRLHYIENSPIPGLAVAERRVANPQATVICVHGALDRGGSFARIARRLENFDVIAYDRRGYQGSRDLALGNLDYHVADLLALAADEAPRQSVVLFGHSFGGIITFGAALSDPSKIRLVVNYESPFQWILPRESTWPPRRDETMSESEQFFRRILSDKEWERLSEQQRASRRMDEPALLSDLSVVRRESAPYDLSQLRVPVTYAYGKDESSNYYRLLGEKLMGVSPMISTYGIERAGHAAHLKNPAQLAALVRERWDHTCASE